MYRNKRKYNTPWAKPLSILFLISILVFIFNRIVDYFLLKYGFHFLQGFLSSDIGNLTNTLGGLGEVVTSVLGIEITAVAIIVQLAANKYSSKIMELFVKNKINFFITGLFVVTAINAILVANTVSSEFLTAFSISFTLLLIVLSLLVVIPHFSYVFDFLKPNNFLKHIFQDTLDNLEKLSEPGVVYDKRYKDRINENIEFIGDIAINSVHQGDRAVALLCLTTLREITVKYLGVKDQLPAQWFRLTGDEYLDPDFSNYSHFVMERIEEGKILLERKILRLYELIFNNSRSTLKDVASGVLLNTELIAMEAIKLKKPEVRKCLYQYFNSYLRAAISGKDPRSAFNTLEHYRIVAESLLEEEPGEIEDLAFYFKYYGHEANKNKVLFILETAAHDLCHLNELAYEKKSPVMKNLLDIFLKLDEPIEDDLSIDKASELSLIGVRIAQVKLAGFYLLKGECGLARIIFEDMQVEPVARIKKIKDTIFNTRDEEFWEITPRGVNFNYVSRERRTALEEFFSWF